MADQGRAWVLLNALDAQLEGVEVYGDYDVTLIDAARATKEADEAQRMRESAVFAMGRSADVYWGDTVMLELRAASPAMRYEAARAAGEIMHRPAVAPLIQLVDDPDAEVRNMAVWALGQIGGKQARAVIERLLGGPDEALAEAAEAALHELEFANGVMEMFVHELDEEDGVMLDGSPFDDEDDDPPDDDWDGDALRLP